MAEAQSPSTIESGAEEGRLETLKRLVGYIPEVRLARAVVRWVKAQPPADPLPQPVTPDTAQAR